MSMTPEQGQRLVEIARSALEACVTGSEPTEVAEEPWLLEPRATFVTLMSRGDLRGCIGSLRIDRPLVEDLRSNARAAALHDSRFPRVRPTELAEIRVEVSVLSPLEPLEFASEDELLALLEPDRDGLVIDCGGHRATFLPQVWESLPRPAHFLGQLKKKAGLAANFWSPDLRAWRFVVDKFKEA